jgi:cell division protein FtsL
MSKERSNSFVREPRVAIVLIAGTLTIIFLVAIVRELLQGHQVRTQVRRLRDDVAAEEQRQRDLQNLLTYLQSPTFQERQARLELGLKKNGERVLVVPPNSTDTPSTATKTSPTSTTDSPTVETSNPSRWWQYFLRK